MAIRSQSFKAWVLYKPQLTPTLPVLNQAAAPPSVPGTRNNARALHLRHLQYFVAAAEAVRSRRHRGALRCRRRPLGPRSLWSGAGLQCIRHHAQGLSLTASGRQMLREAKALLAQADALHASARDLTEQARGPLNVGCLVTLAPIILPELCHAFQQRFPAVLVSIHEGDQEHLIDRLRREIDIPLTYDLQVEDGRSGAGPAAALCLAVAGARWRRTLSLHDLAPEPPIPLDLPLSRVRLLSAPLPGGPDAADRGRARPHPDVIRTMVANQYGYALFNARRATMRRWTGAAASGAFEGTMSMSLGLASLRQSGRPRALIEFEEHCRVAINQRGIPGLVIQSK
jgi:DNA-binding transcriptional LysR family regulator